MTARIPTMPKTEFVVEAQDGDSIYRAAAQLSNQREALRVAGLALTKYGNVQIRKVQK